jgi:DNA-binding XRE family transcriptional regulator
MNKTKRAALESAGWTFGDFGDFLGLTDAERRLVEFRARLAVAIREARERKAMTQGQLAQAIKSTQPRVVKIEQGAAGVSLDQMLQAYFAAGGEAPRLAAPRTRPKKAIGRRVP